MKRQRLIIKQRHLPCQEMLLYKISGAQKSTGKNGAFLFMK